MTFKVTEGDEERAIIGAVLRKVGVDGRIMLERELAGKMVTVIVLYTDPDDASLLMPGKELFEKYDEKKSKCQEGRY
jgi:hypothetical protein